MKTLYRASGINHIYGSYSGKTDADNFVRLLHFVKIGYLIWHEHFLKLAMLPMDYATFNSVFARSALSQDIP
jgi:hypothetical protein